MQENPYYHAYEKRYKAVYEVGGERWGHNPDDEELIGILTEWVNQNNLKGKKIIEFACGEGASGVILSKLGCIYHGLDVSPTVVEKAKSLLCEFPDAKVTQQDMVLQKPNGTELYDAALDVMGFHMLVTDPHRKTYLNNAFACLKNNAPMLFVHELYSEDTDDNFISSFTEWLSITKNDYNTPRQMNIRKKDGEEIEIHIPYVPGRAKTKDGYLREMSETGFIVDSIVKMKPSHKVTKSVSLYVHKP